MIKYLLVFITILGLAWLLFPLLRDFETAENLRPLGQAYIRGAAEDLAIPNVVTAVVVTYRGLDTLGEVTVLFLAATGVGLLLKIRQKQPKKRRKGSELLQTGAGFLSPLIVSFGVYIFVHGHLSPGGGFQGGVVIASGLLLMILADTAYSFPHKALQVLEAVSGFGYVMLGLAGLLLIGLNSFLDPRILPGGGWLQLFSGGAIPVIYSLVGLKVGAELSGIVDSMQEGGE